MRHLSFVYVLFIIVFCNLQILQSQPPRQVNPEYLSPRPGAKFVTPQHNIAIRQGDVFDLNSISADVISVAGSRSGIHKGILKLSADSKTLIFTPDNPFQYDETVNVNISEGIFTISGKEVKPFNFSFMTMKKDNLPLKEAYCKQVLAERKAAYIGTEAPAVQQKSVKASMNLPGDYPDITITVNHDPAPGYMFLTPINLFAPLDQPSYLIIQDSYGTPVYYKQVQGGAADFKIQKNGMISHFFPSQSGGLGVEYGSFLVYDNNMTLTDTFQMGNGYMAELHDFQLLENGYSLMFTYDPQIIDMSAIVEGGDSAATVMGFVFQELDENKNVILEWSSWDNLNITDVTPDIDLTSVFIDYCHGNSIEMDNDGNILVSFRHRDEILKISSETGAIMWHLNAFHDVMNDFTFTNDTIKFSHQHDVRRQANGHLTLFDNGNLHYGPYTRLCEYALDEVNMTAELVWVYPESYDSTDIFSFAMGSAHRQPNGNTTAGWGIGFTSLPIAGEVSVDHQVTQEIYAPDTLRTYRAHKFQWQPDLFTTSKDTINYGEFTGYTAIPYILVLTNNSDQPITISGTHNRTPNFFVAGVFPMTIDPGSTANFTVNFLPSTDGRFRDVLTIYCALDEKTSIARQVMLTGYTQDNSAPDVTFNPSDGTTDVSLFPDLKITFDEKIYKAGGIAISNADLADVLEFKKESSSGTDIPFKAMITWYDNSRTELIVKPQIILDTLTDYYIAVKPDVLEDWSANKVTGDNSVVFTTGNQLGVDENGESLSAVLYPNPSSGIFCIAFSSDDVRDISIYDIKGNLVFEKTGIMGNAASINIGYLQNGFYLVRITDRKIHKSTDLKLLKN